MWEHFELISLELLEIESFADKNGDYCEFQSKFKNIEENNANQNYRILPRFIKIDFTKIDEYFEPYAPYGNERILRKFTNHEIVYEVYKIDFVIKMSAGLFFWILE